MIRTKNIDPACGARYIVAGIDAWIPGTAAIANALAFFVWPFTGRSPYDPSRTNANAPFPLSGKIVDIIIGQSYAGVGGTSYTVTLAKNGTAVCSTNAVVALAGGANAATDALGALTVPTGWTRPVLKTDSTIWVKKGDVLSLTTTVSGTYTTSANLSLIVLIDPVNV